MTLKHILGDLPVIRILGFLMDHPGKDYTKSEIAVGAEVGPTDMKRDFSRLAECGVIFETRKVGGVGLYVLDVTNEMTQALIEFDVKLTEYCMKKTDEALDKAYGEGLPEPED